MNDLIDRQTAICIASIYYHPADIANALAKLPSAQPELIRCKDCKCWDTSGYCIDFMTQDEGGFCAWAERWKNEDNNQI